MEWLRSSWARTRALGSRARARGRFSIRFRDLFFRERGRRRWRRSRRRLGEEGSYLALWIYYW